MVLNLLHVVQIFVDPALVNVVLQPDVLFDLPQEFQLLVSDENFPRVLSGRGIG